MNLRGLRLSVKNLASSRIAKDSLLQFFLNLLGASFGFFQLPLLLKMLGGQGFGELVLFQTVVGIYSAFTLIQFYQGMMKFSPKSDNSNEIMHKLFRIGVVNEFLSILLLCFLLSFFNNVIAKQLHYLNIHGPLFFLSVAITTALGYSQSIIILLRLLGKYHYVIVWGALSSALRFCILLIFPLFHVSISWVIFSSFLLPEIAKLIGLFVLVPPFILFSRSKKVQNIKQIISFSFIVTAQEWCDLPVKQFDKIILSFFVQPVDVGIYQILRKIGNLMAMVVAPFSTSFFHEFSERINMHNLHGALRLFYKSVVGFTIVSLVLAIGLLLSKQYWSPRLFTGIYVSPILVTEIILIYVIVNGFNSIHSLLYALDGINESFVITVISNIVFFVLAIGLGSRYYAFGLVSAFGLQVIMLTIAKIIVVNKKQQLLLKTTFRLRDFNDQKAI